MKTFEFFIIQILAETNVIVLKKICIKYKSLMIRKRDKNNIIRIHKVNRVEIETIRSILQRQKNSGYVRK